MSATPFHIVQEDLEGLDSKTKAGLEPLLNALNVTLSDLVSASGGVPEQWITQTLKTDATVADSFPIVFKNPLGTKPRGVFLANIKPKDEDHSLTTPFVLNNWTLTDAGLISVSWVTGILALNTYTLTFLIK